jgi:hypothetical protein
MAQASPEARNARIKWAAFAASSLDHWSGNLKSSRIAFTRSAGKRFMNSFAAAKRFESPSLSETI